jgi:hypothetical protein
LRLVNSTRSHFTRSMTTSTSTSRMCLE